MPQRDTGEFFGCWNHSVSHCGWLHGYMFLSKLAKPYRQEGAFAVRKSCLNNKNQQTLSVQRRGPQWRQRARICLSDLIKPCQKPLSLKLVSEPVLCPRAAQDALWLLYPPVPGTWPQRSPCPFCPPARPPTAATGLKTAMHTQPLPPKAPRCPGSEV